VVTKDDMAELSGQVALLRRGMVELNDPDLDPDQRHRLSNQIEAQVETSEAVSEANRIFDDIDKLIKGTELSSSDERFSDAVALWEEGHDGTIDLAKLNRAFRLFSRVVYDYQKEQTEEAKTLAARQQRQEDLDLAGPGGQGGGNGRRQFTAAEIGAMPPEEYAKNRQYIVK
jgi:hypothetical protein